MKGINDYIIERGAAPNRPIKDAVPISRAKDIISGEAFLDKNDLVKSFLQLIDSANYNLSTEHNIDLTSAETAEIVCKAMEKYKNFK